MEEGFAILINFSLSLTENLIVDHDIKELVLHMQKVTWWNSVPKIGAYSVDTSKPIGLKLNDGRQARIEIRELRKPNKNTNPYNKSIPYRKIWYGTTLFSMAHANAKQLA